MGATDTFAWPWPNLGDPANGPAAFQASLDAVEDTVKDTTIQSYTPTWSSIGAAQPFGATTLVGRYRVDHGICHVLIYLQAGPSTNGGVGDLRLSLPLTPTFPWYQVLAARHFTAVAGGGLYLGLADIPIGSGTIVPYFPASPADARLGAWRNTTAGAVGTGVPLVSGGYPVSDGSSVVIQGSYFL